MTPFEIAERSKDLKSIENYYSNQLFTWNGNQYLGVMSTLKDTIIPERGTFSVQTFISITARAEQWPDEVYPKGQDFLYINNRRFQVVTVEADLQPTQLVIFCNEDTKGVKG